MKSALNFKIVDTEEEAVKLCGELDGSSSRYMRKNHPARYTPWSNEKQTEKGFAVWYYA